MASEIPSSELNIPDHHFLVDWFWSLLFQLGLWKKNATLLLVGLDNAGKTTLLYKLKNRSLRMFIPTQRAQLEEVVVGNVQFRAWDLGGHEQVRSLWKDYYFEANAVIFVVDVADEERYEEAKNELHHLLNDKNLGEVIFLILGNKTDLKPEVTRNDVVSWLDIQPQIDSGRKMEVFLSSLLQDNSFQDAFKWLSDIL